MLLEAGEGGRGGEEDGFEECASGRIETEAGGGAVELHEVEVVDAGLADGVGLGGARGAVFVLPDAGLASRWRRLLTSTAETPSTVMATAGRMVTERAADLELAAEIEALRIRLRKRRVLALTCILGKDHIDQTAFALRVWWSRIPVPDRAGAVPVHFGAFVVVRALLRTRALT